MKCRERSMPASQSHTHTTHTQPSLASRTHTPSCDATPAPTPTPTPRTTLCVLGLCDEPQMPYCKSSGAPHMDPRPSHPILRPMGETPLPLSRGGSQDENKAQQLKEELRRRREEHDVLEAQAAEQASWADELLSRFRNTSASGNAPEPIVIPQRAHRSHPRMPLATTNTNVARSERSSKCRRTPDPEPIIAPSEGDISIPHSVYDEDFTQQFRKVSERRRRTPESDSNGELFWSSLKETLRGPSAQAALSGHHCTVECNGEELSLNQLFYESFVSVWKTLRRGSMPNVTVTLYKEANNNNHNNHNNPPPPPPSTTHSVPAAPQSEKAASVPSVAPESSVQATMTTPSAKASRRTEVVSEVSEQASGAASLPMSVPTSVSAVPSVPEVKLSQVRAVQPAQRSLWVAPASHNLLDRGKLFGDMAAAASAPTEGKTLEQQAPPPQPVHSLQTHPTNLPPAVHAAQGYPQAPQAQPVPTQTQADAERDREDAKLLHRVKLLEEAREGKKEPSEAPKDAIHLRIAAIEDAIERERSSKAHEQQRRDQESRVSKQEQMLHQQEQLRPVLVRVQQLETQIEQANYGYHKEVSALEQRLLAETDARQSLMRELDNVKNKTRMQLLKLRTELQKETAAAGNDRALREENADLKLKTTETEARLEMVTRQIKDTVPHSALLQTKEQLTQAREADQREQRWLREENTNLKQKISEIEGKLESLTRQLHAPSPVLLETTDALAKARDQDARLRAENDMLKQRQMEVEMKMYTMAHQAQDQQAGSILSAVESFAHSRNTDEVQQLRAENSSLRSKALAAEERLSRPDDRRSPTPNPIVAPAAPLTALSCPSHPPTDAPFPQSQTFIEPLEPLEPLEPSQYVRTPSENVGLPPASVSPLRVQAQLHRPPGLSPTRPTPGQRPVRTASPYYQNNVAPEVPALRSLSDEIVPQPAPLPLPLPLPPAPSAQLPTERDQAQALLARLRGLESKMASLHETDVQPSVGLPPVQARLSPPRIPVAAPLHAVPEEYPFRVLPAQSQSQPQPQDAYPYGVSPTKEHTSPGKPAVSPTKMPLEGAGLSPTKGKYSFWKQIGQDAQAVSMPGSPERASRGGSGAEEQVSSATTRHHQHPELSDAEVSAGATATPQRGQQSVTWEEVPSSRDSDLDTVDLDAEVMQLHASAPVSAAQPLSAPPVSAAASSTQPPPDSMDHKLDFLANEVQNMLNTFISEGGEFEEQISSATTTSDGKIAQRSSVSSAPRKFW